MLYTLIVVMVLASGTKEVDLQTLPTEQACNSAKDKLNAKFASISEVNFVCEQ